MPEHDKPNEPPKATSTGTVKNPTTGSSVKSGESVAKSGVITGDKTEKSPTEESKAANTPTTKALAEQKREAENKESETLEKSFEIHGEALQGDSFRITAKRGNVTLAIPVPIEGSNNVVTLTNTFKLIDEIQKSSTRKELEDKFGAFVQ